MKRLLAAAAAATLLSACAGVTAPGATRSETPQQSLAATGKAMKQVNSVKFDLNGTVAVTLPQPLIDQLKAKGGSQAMLLSSNMTVALKISGAAQKPDRLHATIAAQLGGLTLHTEVIAAGGNLYYRDPMTSKWELVKRSGADKSEAGKAETPGATLSYQAILDTAKSVTEVTDSTSTVNGVPMEHYRIVPDLLKLLAQASAGHAPSNPAAMSALQTVLQNATVAADVWTGTSDHLVHRLSYDADVTADLHQLAGAMGRQTAATVPAFDLPAGSIAHVTAHIVVDLHDFNTRLTIQAPPVAG